jgi:fibronectin-binding autotransporter adhesin
MLPFLGLVLLLGIDSGPPTASAATYTWNATQSGSGPSDGSGTWNTTTTNWWNGSSNIAWPNLSGVSADIAAFGTGSGTGGTVTLSTASTLNVAGLRFNDTASGTFFTLSSGTIAIADSGTIALSIETLARVPVINSVVSGSNIMFAKAGGAAGSNIALGGNNLLTGTTTLSGASGGVWVTANHRNALGTSAIVVESGAAFSPNLNAGGTIANNLSIAGTGVGSRGVIRFDSFSSTTLSGTITMTGDASINTYARSSTISGPIVESGATPRNLSFITTSGSLSANTITLTAASTYSGSTSVTGVTVRLSGGNDRLPASTRLALGGSGNARLVLGGNSQTLAGLSLMAGGTGFVVGGTTTTSALVLNVASGTSTFAGTIGGTATNDDNLTLTKRGAGTFSLTGTNTYNGSTIINAGTLALGLNGSFANSPTITIGDAGSSGAVLDLTAKSNGFTFGSGQTVKGIGTIQMASGKVITISGTLAAGNSPGTLTIAGGDLVLSGASITQYELNGTDATVGSGINDLTTVSGSLTLGGTLNVAASPAFDLFGSRSYRVFNYATSGTGLLAGSMAIGTTPDANYLYSFNTATAGQVDLFVQRRANQSTTFTLTTGTLTRALVSSTVGLSGTVSNSSPTGAAALVLGLGSAGQLAVSGFTSGSVAGGAGGTVAGTISTGTITGSRAWTVVNTDAGAITATSTATGSLQVVDQRQFSVSSGTIALGTFLRTLSQSGSTAISSSGLNASTANATLAGFAGTSTRGFGLALATGTNVFDGTSALQQAAYSLTGSATSAGLINGSFSSSVTAELGSIAPLGVVLTGTALDPAVASYTAGSPTTSWLIDFGSLNQASGTSAIGFSLYNIVQTSGYTADLALLTITNGTSNTNSITTNLTAFNTLAAGSSNPWQAFIATGNLGTFQNTYTLSFKSSNNGTVYADDTPQTLTLTVQGVIVVPEPGAMALAGIGVALIGWVASRRRHRER